MHNVLEQAPVSQPRKARRLGLFSRSFLYTTTSMATGFLSSEALKYVLPEFFVDSAQGVAMVAGIAAGMYFAGREATRSYINLSSFDNNPETMGSRLRITWGAASAAWLSAELFTSSACLLIQQHAWNAPSHPMVAMAYSLVAMSAGVAILFGLTARGDSKDEFMKIYGKPVVMTDKKNSGLSNIKDVTPADLTRPAITDRRHIDRPMARL